MRKISKVITGVLTASMMAMCLMPVQSFASENIKNVVISVIPDEDGMEAGEIYAGLEPYLEEGEVEIESCETNTDDYQLNESYTYTIKLEAEDDYSFNKDTVVQVFGAYDVSISSRSSSSMTVKAKAYPFGMLEDPDGFDEDEGKLTWDKVEGADKYNVFIYYTDSNGNDKEKKQTTSSPSIKISSYEDYDDFNVSVQAVPKTSSKNGKYLTTSRAIFMDGGVDEDKSEEMTIKNFYATSKGTSSDSGSSSSKSSSSSSSNKRSSGSTSSSSGPSASNTTSSNGPSTGNNAQNGWIGSGDDWKYYRDGALVKNDWIDDGGNWYYMDENGNMRHGWLESGGHTYYLNEQHDGTFGRMLAGWQQIGENWYYLNTEHDGTYGRLFRSTTTPDGYTVNESGVWVQ